MKVTLFHKTNPRLDDPDAKVFRTTCDRVVLTCDPDEVEVDWDGRVRLKVRQASSLEVEFEPA